MSLLTKQQILTANDLQTSEVDVPEWGGQVRVRALSAQLLVEISRVSLGADGNIDKGQALDLLVLIPARCIIDEAGQRMFTEADLAALGQKGGDPLKRIMEEVLRLSKVDLDDLKKG